LWGGVHPVANGTLRSIERGVDMKPSKGGNQTRHIAALVREFQAGRLSAHTTDLLNFERWIKPAGRYAGLEFGDATLLRDVRFTNHHTLRNFVFSMPSEQSVIELARQHLRAADCETYRTIRDALDQVASSAKSSQDAWHIRCAIHLNMDVFLTADARLHGQVRSIPNKDLRSRLLRLIQLPRDL
jgi:hypothetical protein